MQCIHLLTSRVYEILQSHIRCYDRTREEQISNGPPIVVGPTTLSGTDR